MIEVRQSGSVKYMLIIAKSLDSYLRAYINFAIEFKITTSNRAIQ